MPRALPDDLLDQILIRLPPKDPGLLFRASLVCKPWRSLLTNANFHRRYCEFHRTPPLLGLLEHRYPHETSCFFSTSSFHPPAPDLHNRCALDARHGRVLLYNSKGEQPMELVVWDPITDAQWSVPLPKPVTRDWNAAVLCASTADGCDHLECHGGPFLVALLYTEKDMVTSACVYSSEVGAWSDLTSLEDEWTCVIKRPSVLVGSTVYFICKFSLKILRYDLVSRELSVIEPPLVLETSFVLVTVDDGALGLASLHELSIYLWSMDVDVNGAAGWVQHRVIKLEKLLPTHRALSITTEVTGFAEEIGVIFLSTTVGVFTIDLKSGSVRKVPTSGFHDFIVPYISFCTPGHARGIMPPP